MQTNVSIAVLIPAIALWAAPVLATTVRAPFVGCPANGQVGPLAPPAGKARIIHVEGPLPGPIAYYKGAQGDGVFAPAGWHCDVSYGSAGAWLVVTPHRISYLTDRPFSFAPPIIEMSTLDGETSGRFIVAQLGLMLFPKRTKKYIDQIERETGLTPAQVLTQTKLGIGSADKLTYLSKQAVQFVTPANKKGLGTEGAVKVAKAPIQGIVVLYEYQGDPIGMTVLRTSLGVADQRWVSALLKINALCMRLPNGC